jgi:hypothetical protein
MGMTQEYAGTESLSSVDDFYNGATITLIAGNNIKQTRLITDYVANTQTITVDPAFGANCDIRLVA